MQRGWLDWMVESFACDVKEHLLYGNKTQVIQELPNGDKMEAEIGFEDYCGEDWINLSLCYRHRGEIQTDANVILEWFPNDETLVQTIREIYQQECAA